MVEHDLSEIKVREGETAIILRKPSANQPVMMPPPVAAPVAAPAVPAPAEPEQAEDDGLVPVPSPMVGTAYMAPDPESPPFVSVGAEIQPETTVCIIEAMKVFNEIRSEVSGTVERILVQNEQAIEFGQPILLVRPKS